MSDGRPIEPVRVLARGRDATLACRVLGEADIPCAADPSCDEVLRRMDEVHLLLAAEEMLDASQLSALRERLAAQPPWSDLPIVVVARRGGPPGWAIGAVEALGNVSVLERPLKIDELVTAVRTGLRARRRQFEVRDLLHARTEADRRKDEFLAMLAHELRNPLAPIRGVAGLMRTLDVVDPELVQAREILERQVRHMARLVDDLLDVSRITRGAIELRPRRVDLVDLARHAARAATPAIESRGHRFSQELPETPAYVDGDPTRLEQVLSNLLSNAAKYTDPGGSIRLRIENAPPHAILSVEDDGVGIAPNVLPRVFDLFAQADSSLDRTRGGLGVGLTIVKRLVELHGGSIDIRSEGLGKGTRVTVRLPMPEARTGVDGVLTQPPAQREGRPLRVLLVEDNKDAADLLKMSLGHEGHELCVAYDGVAGLSAAKSFRPDVVISDIGLPGLDGHELARTLRGDPSLKELLLVAVTGYGDEDSLERSREAGFDHHFVKPIDIETLSALLKDRARDGGDAGARTLSRGGDDIDQRAIDL